MGGTAHENLQGKMKRTRLRRGTWHFSYRKVIVRAMLNTRASRRQQCFAEYFTCKAIDRWAYYVRTISVPARKNRRRDPVPGSCGYLTCRSSLNQAHLSTHFRGQIRICRMYHHPREQLAAFGCFLFLDSVLRANSNFTSKRVSVQQSDKRRLSRGSTARCPAPAHGCSLVERLNRNGDGNGDGRHRTVARAGRRYIHDGEGRCAGCRRSLFLLRVCTHRWSQRRRHDCVCFTDDVLCRNFDLEVASVYFRSHSSQSSSRAAGRAVSSYPYPYRRGQEWHYVARAADSAAGPPAVRGPDERMVGWLPNRRVLTFLSFERRQSTCVL